MSVGGERALSNGFGRGWVDNSLKAMKEVQLDIERRGTGEPDPRYLRRLDDPRKQATSS
jgi:hypothetical protein